MARPRSEEARQRALDATVEVLLDCGFDGFAIEEVVARSGVAKSTIYRHFGSRDGLLLEALRGCLIAPRTPDTGSLAGDLTELFAGYDSSDDNKRLNDLIPLLLDASRRDPQVKAITDEILAERQRPARTVLRLAQGRGEVDPRLDMDLAMAILFGPFTYRRMVQDAEVDGEFLATILPAAIAALRSTAVGPG